MMERSQRRLVVVIDASQTHRAILRTISVRGEYDVVTFPDPVPAWEALFVAHQVPIPHVLFVDIELPHISGYKVIKKMRRDPKGFTIPIVVVTRLNDPYHRLLARLAGATEYVPKPIQRSYIAELLCRYAQSNSAS